ncbi:MAG: TldD/PmbA family protein [Nitrospirae bacterium]|nr:TldD/PmbA family protein [Nitrospirota bacterium]
MIDRDLLASLISVAKKAGVDYSDIFVEQRRSFVAELEDGKIERITTGVDIGAGLRVIIRGKTYYAYTNNLKHDNLKEIMKTLVNADKWTDDSYSLDLIEPLVDFSISLPPDEVSANKKVDLVVTADRVARSESNKIKQVKAVYRDTMQDILIANTDGIIAEDQRVYTVFLVQVVATDGKEIQTGYEPIGGLIGFELFEGTPVELVAKTAASRAVMMLTARKMPGGRMPVVISSEAGGTMIHEAIGHGLEADLAGQGLSVYSGKLGQQVASEVVTVVDDATLKNKRGSFRFDDEGTPSQRTVLVEKGVLVGYLYDRYNAMREGKHSTGNGRRESYQHRPIPRMTNTFIEPGSTDPQEIVKSIDRGLFVKKMGGGQVNTINGDFVFEVQEGYLIEKGSIGEPVRGATITGNGPEVLKSIDLVGNDLGFAIGTCGKDGQGVPVSDAMPTIRVPEMVVGGEACL